MKTPSKKGPKPTPLAVRFATKWQLDPATGCHVWTATTQGTGYGLIYTAGAGRQQLAHRVSYEMAKGPIPEGLHIDHLCRNKLCVNPAHLEAVKSQENHRRGNSWGLKSHCRQGHALTAENVYVRPNGGRRCRECERATARKWIRKVYVKRTKRGSDSLPPNAGLLSLAFL